MLAKAKYKNLISNFANKKTHIYIYILETSKRYNIIDQYQNISFYC